MPLGAEESKSSSKPSQKRSNWGLRFIIAVAGAAVSFWLARRQDAHKLPPLPTFHERFWLVAPTLFAGAAGILFLIWIGLLFLEAGERSKPKLISSVAVDDAEKKKSWTAVKTAIFVIYVLVTIPSFGGEYFKYLWPGYPQWISHAARPIFDVLTFLGAFVASTRRRRNQKPQPGTGYGEEKGPWLDDRQQAFIAVALIGAAIVFGIHHAVRNLPPVTVLRITAISATVIGAILLALLQSSRKPEQTPEQSAPHSDIAGMAAGPGAKAPHRGKLGAKIATWIIVTLIMLVMISPAPSQVKTIVFFAPIAILVIWAVMLTKLKSRVFRLSMQGKFDQAIQADRRCSQIPGYGNSLAGLIYFNAGRYAEAQALAKPFAFDEQGKPKVASTDFYVYALALENDGLEAEAQKLLEAAVAAPQRMAGFHVALATCLLSQKKDATRACELLEQAMASPERPMPAYERNSDHITLLARYAWALAAAGRRPEAETRLQEAFASSMRLKDRDLAGVHYFAGEAWRSLGEWKKARAAFDEALRLSPEGNTAMNAKKALAKLREEERS